jgi:tuftelin-interacting protein 11
MASSSSESDDGNDIRSMAGLRKINQKMAGPSKLGAWEQHTKGIGAKLLLQMGYQPGKGLGKELQGISAPVQATLRKGRGAIGAYGPEQHASHKEQGKKTADDPEMSSIKDGQDKKQQWKKGDTGKKDKKKIRYFYKSVEDVIEKGKKPGYMLNDRNSKMSQVTVIDMTGPEKRVLSGYHAMGQTKVADEELYEHRPQKTCTNFQLPELMHNLNLIVDQCEQVKSAVVILSYTLLMYFFFRISL